MRKNTWRDIFLPRSKPLDWTWHRILLLCVSVALFVDSCVVVDSHDLDPGVTGEAMLFMILGYRAAAYRQVSLPVIFAGALLAVFTSLLNHRVLRISHGFVSLLVEFGLLAVVVFCGSNPKESELLNPVQADDKSILNLSKR